MFPPYDSLVDLLRALQFDCEKDPADVYGPDVASALEGWLGGAAERLKKLKVHSKQGVELLRFNDVKNLIFGDADIDATDL